jgi:ATP-binding cassette, subfamily B, multidrug efflux pump
MSKGSGSSHPHSNMYTASKGKPKNWAYTVKRIGAYFSDQKVFLILVLLMVILSSALSLLGPFLIGFAIDEYVVKGDYAGMQKLLAGLVFVFAGQSASIWLQNYWMIGIAQQTVFKMRRDLFLQFHRLPISFFDKRQHGELMSRVTNDIENVSSTLNSSFIQVFSSLLMLIGTVGVMLYLSPMLTAISLSIVPLMIFGLKWITKRTGARFKEQQRNLGEINGYIEEITSGQRIVKSFSQEKRVIAEFMSKNERLRESGYWAQTFSGFIPKLMNLLNNASFALIAGIGGILALNGKISIGVIVIFVEYSRQFTRPLNDLANQFNTLLSAVAGAERVFEILDEPQEEKDEGSAAEVSFIRGNVVFKDVSFSYEKGEDEDTISGLTFSVKEGETVALVGPTGAGKTTVVNLLSRFYRADRGEILIDGIPIEKIRRHSLRSHMGFVLQDSFLFEGTISDNIRYGKLDASDDEVRKAAERANAHSFIMKLPNGYETFLSQEGSSISQGQRQLLSIARAILADPTLLILDEATSSIDTITEMKIQEALQRLMKGRTSFVIAHRLNTIQKADQILVLNDGGILERGTHDELLRAKGFYYSLYHSQLKEEA